VSTFFWFVRLIWDSDGEIAMGAMIAAGMVHKIIDDQLGRLFWIW